MEELLAKIKDILEQGLSQSGTDSPWPVRVADRSYPILYAAKTYYVPKEIAALYHTLKLSEPDYFISRLEKLVQSCAFPCSWLGKNSFFQTIIGTGRALPTQEIFNWLNTALQSCNQSNLAYEFSCNTIQLALSDDIIKKLETILKAATTARPWPLGWAGTILSPALDVSDKRYQVPQEIFQLYELAQLHRDPAARVKKVLALTETFQKTLQKEKYDWQHADVIDMPFLYVFGLREKAVHDLGETLGNIVAQYLAKTSTPQPI